MKKIAFLLGSFLLLAGLSGQGQSFLKFENFFFTKGYVLSIGNHYEYCTFSIKEKGTVDVAVDKVAIQGKEAGFFAVTDGKVTEYTVMIPRSVRLVQGDFFDLEITFGYSAKQPLSLPQVGWKDQLHAGVSALCSDNMLRINSYVKPDAGGPVGSVDPTIIVIKYP